MNSNTTRQYQLSAAYGGSVSQSSTQVTKLTLNFVSWYFFNVYSLPFISEYQLLPKHVACLSKLLPFNMLFHFSAIHYLSYLPLWIMIHPQKIFADILTDIQNLLQSHVTFCFQLLYCSPLHYSHLFLFDSKYWIIVPLNSSPIFY